MLSLPARASVVEVGPRDGLQSLGRWVETEDKVKMIDRLSAAGFPVIEVTGLVRASVIPNLRDAEAVLARIRRRPGTVYRALVPNARGAERAVAAGADELLGLITVSEAYLARNQNMTMAAALEQGVRCCEIARAAGKRFVMAVGMSMWCPYEGRIPEEKALAVAEHFHRAGVRRLYFAGSVGMEDPRHVNGLFRRARERFPDMELGYHVHNVPGFGTANVLAALDGGASWLEGSICGVGGGIAMPGHMGDVGNLPSEDIVHLLEEMGVDCGVSTADALAAARDIAALLGLEPMSHALRGGTRAAMRAPTTTEKR